LNSGGNSNLFLTARKGAPDLTAGSELTFHLDPPGNWQKMHAESRGERHSDCGAEYLKHLAHPMGVPLTIRGPPVVRPDSLSFQWDLQQRRRRDLVAVAVVGGGETASQWGEEALICRHGVLKIQQIVSSFPPPAAPSIRSICLDLSPGHDSQLFRSCKP
jgi:hypothetical protein